MSTTTVNLGYVPKNRGEYSSTASYYKDNIVQYNGSSYICNPPNYDPDTAPTASITGVAPYASDPAVPNTGWAVFCNDSSGVGEGVYDVSVDHTTDNQPKKYADLSAALQDVPQAKQKGGMTIRFIQTYDNKYVRYNLLADSFTTDVTQWQGVDDEPTAGSKNIVESGGVASLHYVSNKETINNVFKAAFLHQTNLLDESYLIQMVRYTIEQGGVNRIFVKIGDAYVIQYDNLSDDLYNTIINTHVFPWLKSLFYFNLENIPLGITNTVGVKFNSICRDKYSFSELEEFFYKNNEILQTGEYFNSVFYGVSYKDYKGFAVSNSSNSTYLIPKRGNKINVTGVDNSAILYYRYVKGDLSNMVPLHTSVFPDGYDFCSIEFNNSVDLSNLKISQTNTICGKIDKLNEEFNNFAKPESYGAYFDGIHDDYYAIQQCIDENDHVIFSGNKTALVSKSLVVHSNTWLDFDNDFRLKLMDNSNCPLIKNQWADQIYFMERMLINGQPPSYIYDLYPDYGTYPSSTYVLGDKDENIKITGGILDGNGGNQTINANEYGCFGYTGRLLTLVHVRNLVMDGITMYDPQGYFTEFCLLEHFEVRNINLELNNLRNNQDGLHFDGECYDGIIDNIYGQTNDDMVTFNGGDSWYAASENPEINNVIQYPYKRGKIARIKVSNIFVKNGLRGYRATRLLSNNAEGFNETEGIEDIYYDGIFGNYKIDVVLISSHIGDTKHYKNLYFKNISGYSSSTTNPRIIWIQNKTHVESLVIDNFRYDTSDINKNLITNQGVVDTILLQNVLLGGTTGCESKGLINNTGTISKLKLINVENRGTQYQSLVEGNIPSLVEKVMSDF